jgi:hypothetical protein
MVGAAEGGLAHGKGTGYRRDWGHRCYYAEYVKEISAEPQGLLQALLDEMDAREWHLVGVAGGLEGGAMILF